MNIRKATYHDAPAIKLLLGALGYDTRTSILVHQLETLFGQEDHQIFVYVSQREVSGFVAVHFMPQLAFDGGLVFISYLAAEEPANNSAIAKALEQFVVELARKKKSDRIQVHCMDWRTPTHKFYVQQGYQEYPKYFTKRLVYAE